MDDVFDWEKEFSEFDDNKTNNTKQIEANEKVHSDLLNDNCPKCLGKSCIRIDNGFLVCGKCGETYTLIEKKPDWKISNDDSYDKFDRCGGPVNPFLPQSSLGSILGGSTSYKLRKIQGWTQMPYHERTLWIVCEEMDHIGSKNGIPVVAVKDAKNYYRIVSSLKHTSGKNKGKAIITRAKKRKALIAACFYNATQHNKLSYTHKELAKMFDLKPNDLTKGIKRFEELVSNSEYKHIVNQDVSSIYDYIERYCCLLKINYIIPLAKKIAKRAEEMYILCECIPTSIAAGSIFYVCVNLNLEITKKQISQLQNYRMYSN